jgi:putative ABC transport system permease protein
LPHQGTSAHPERSSTAQAREIDPGVAVSGITAMDDAVSDRHFSTVLIGLFSGLALLLAAIGIYGVISFSVSQRTHEIGIRMALGARLGQVQWMVVGAALKMVLTGLAIGALVSLLALRLISGLLFNIRYSDPEVNTMAAVVLVVVGMLAAFLPARRAAKVDPIVALRYE